MSLKDLEPSFVQDGVLYINEGDSMWCCDESVDKITIDIRCDLELRQQMFTNELDLKRKIEESNIMTKLFSNKQEYLEYLGELK
jgi:hypothetical protein